MNLPGKKVKTSETSEQLILAEMNANTQREKDIIHLKQIILSIRPYSRWWRWGYVGSLRRAIRAMEKQEDSCRRKKGDGSPGRVKACPARNSGSTPRCGASRTS